MIRDLRECDLPEVIAIAKRAYAGIFAGFAQQLGDEVYRVINPDPPMSRETQLLRHIAANPDCCYVVERDGKVVGFITFFCDRERRIGVIDNNAVDPECGEKGVGQEMYRAVLERFRREQMLLAQVTTGCDEAHAPARRAYERAGFDLHTESITYTQILNRDNFKDK